MPITFGSVGDIIAVSLLVKDVLVALDDGRGATAEYQEIIRELYILDRALLQVSQLSKAHETTPEIASLCHVAAKAVQDCQHSVETFLRRIDKYSATLSADSTSTVLGKATRKLQFAADKKALSQFRAEIMAHSGSLNMLLTIANIKIVAVSEKSMRNQVDENFHVTNGILQMQNATLHDIQQRLDGNNQFLNTNKATLDIIADRLQWLRDLGVGLKTMMTNIFFINLATYRSVLSLQARLPDAAERSMAQFQEPIILEDAIGRLAPVHMQFVSSWEMFDSVLEMRFEGAPGCQKIKRKEYILQDQATLQDVHRERKFDVSFLPGQRVHMSMLFGSITHCTGCPRCHFISDTDSRLLDVDIKCEMCGIVFQHTFSTSKSLTLQDDLHQDREGSKSDEWRTPNTNLMMFKRIRMIMDQPMARAMFVPRARREVPPPLPPPRHIDENSGRADTGWIWGFKPSWERGMNMYPSKISLINTTALQE